MTTLSARLRRERERQGIALDEIASTTKISASLFEGLERGDVSRWPSGIFRRSFIRAYATAIGLDPEAVCREFTEQFPEASDTTVERRRTSQPSDHHPSRRESGPVLVEHKPASPLRLTLAEAGGSFKLRSVLDEPRHRVAAAAFDASAIIALAGMGYLVAGHFWTTLALAAICYCAVSVLVLGCTPAVSWFLARSETPADAAHVATRPHLLETPRHAVGDEPLLARPLGAPKLHRLARIERRRGARA